MVMDVKEFIEHHGIKGMRWGVRGGVGRARAAKNSDRTRFEKAPKRLTNAELEKRIRRMEIEKKYNDLNKRDISVGEKLATEITTNVGRSVVTTVATGAALLAIRTAVNRKMGEKAAVRKNLGLPSGLDVGALITKRGK